MKLAVIGTFHRRLVNTEQLVRRVMLDSTRRPDEFWILCEDYEDTAVAQQATWALDSTGYFGCRVVHVPTPPNVVPYSNKINWALDRTSADAICYLDNGSMPHPDKYRVMLEGLEQHPEWGAVYCGQLRTGYLQDTVPAESPISDPYCVLNYTQVMHRPTPHRWSLRMEDATPNDLVDAIFWRDLAGTLGEFWPVGVGQILDEHHMESATAVGL